MRSIHEPQNVRSRVMPLLQARRLKSRLRASLDMRPRTSIGPPAKSREA